MSRLHFRPRTWGLRTRLLVPLIVITIGAAGALSSIQDLSTREQSEALMEERGAGALRGIVQQLQERQRSEEIVAQLLAQQRSVVTAVETGDRVSLAQELAHHAAKLRLGAVEVFGADRRGLLRFGPAETGMDRDRLVVSALSGRTDSASGVGGNGLAPTLPCTGPRPAASHATRALSALGPNLSY